jgi:hypothetical protein
MSKGLPRSTARARPALAQVVTKRIPLKDFQVAVAGTTGVGFGTAPISGLPQGNILLLGAVAYARFSKNGDADVQDAFDGDFSIGTVPTADVDVSDTGEADIIASTALGAATAGLSPALRATNATQAIIDNTDGDLELNLNLLIDDANISGSATFLVNGSLNIAYIVLGDD